MHSRENKTTVSWVDSPEWLKKIPWLIKSCFQLINSEEKHRYGVQALNQLPFGEAWAPFHSLKVRLSHITACAPRLHWPRFPRQHGVQPYNQAQPQFWLLVQHPKSLLSPNRPLFNKSPVILHASTPSLDMSSLAGDVQKSVLISCVENSAYDGGLNLCKGEIKQIRCQSEWWCNLANLHVKTCTPFIYLFIEYFQPFLVTKYAIFINCKIRTLVSIASSE